MFEGLAGVDAATTTPLVAFEYEFVNGFHGTAKINARQSAMAMRVERIRFGMTNEWRLRR
jgi:hypothetical protein